MLISGWGNYPRAETRLSIARAPHDISKAIAAETALIARGAGRSYGDAAIGSNATLNMQYFNRIIAFDSVTGLLTVEAGASLADLIDTFVPRGFFPPVVPGTRYVTVGGLVAANVHGKNHHGVGGFGKHVEQLTLVLADGSEIECSVQKNAELFRATIGGMGLTGVIKTVAFRLKPIASAFIKNETLIAQNLDVIIEAFERSRQSTYSVAWIDCLARGAAMGRSILFRGEHARPEDVNEDSRNSLNDKLSPQRKLAVPFYLPNFTLSRFSVGIFNSLYYYFHRESVEIVPLLRYFFPLDTIDQWNRIYGRRGFVQHQCVIPKAVGRDVLHSIIEMVSSRGDPSFLAVLKLLGLDDVGMLSFPLEGYTLTLDFPVNTSTLNLLDEIDKLLIANGGRVYLAKDARQSPALMEAGYPQLNAFRTVRRQSGASKKFRSLQSDRLSL